MKKGILNVVTFYGLGLVLTWLAYEISGAGYHHGPRLYMLIPFLTLLLGLFWTGTTIFNYYFKNKTDQRKGAIYGNALVFILFSGTIFYMRKAYEFLDTNKRTDEILSSKQNGDTISMKYNETTMFLQIKDSIYIDKRDSITGTLK